jgi:glycosyltransferase involved in cell wall biosynthesis
LSEQSRPLRVLYFIGSYGPDVMGNASHEEIVVEMGRRGHEVEVLTQINEAGAPRYSRVVYSGVPVYRINLAARLSGFRAALGALSGKAMHYAYLPALLRAYRSQMRRGYDLAHVEGAYPFGFVAAQAGGSVPYLANVQGADVIDLPDYDYGYRRFPLPRLAVKRALRRATAIRAISGLLKDYLVAENLAPSEKIAVIYRAIEAQAFPAPGGSLQDLRERGRLMLAERYGIGLPRPVIMTLSRLHPFKGLEYLVDALGIIVRTCREQDTEPPWLIIGGPARTTESYGDYRAFLQKRAEDQGIAQYVVFTGQIEHEEVKLHLAGADVFACPSILEAQNKVVPEAAAVGTPSVVTETTGIASYLAPLGACVTIRPADAGELSSALLRLMSDQPHLTRLQQNALRAADSLRVQNVAPQLEAVWLRAASKG